MTTALSLQQTKAFETGDFAAMAAQFRHYPMLTLEREQELTERVHTQKDRKAAEELILSHMRYVIKVAKGYVNYGLPAKDLVQEGTIGLMKAVKNFKPSVGVRLVTYASHWIKAEIQEYILKNWRLVKIATTKAQRKLFFNLRKLRQSIDSLSNDATKQIADTLSVSEADVRHMELRMNAKEESYEPMQDDEDGYIGHENTLTVAHDNPEYIAVVEEQQRFEQTHLKSALKRLDSRELAIIERRWFSEKKAPFKNLAKDFGLSIERVRQIEAEAIQKLREGLV